MRHPGILLIPVLMLSDYLLTIAGARLRASAYASHFRTPHYELNPLWQDAIAKLRWINVRHLLITAVFTAFLIAVFETWQDVDEFAEIIEGLMIGAFGSVNGRHLGNLGIFWYIKRHPESVEGVVTMSHEVVLWISLFQMLGLFMPALLLACFLPRPIVIGFAGGAAMLIAVHFGWIRRHRRKLRESVRAAAHNDAIDVEPDSASSASGTKRP